MEGGYRLPFRIFRKEGHLQLLHSVIVRMSKKGQFHSAPFR